MYFLTDLGKNSAVAILPTMCSLLLQSCRELPSPGNLMVKSDDTSKVFDVKIKVYICMYVFGIT